MPLQNLHSCEMRFKLSLNADAIRNDIITCYYLKWIATLCEENKESGTQYLKVK